MNTHELIVDAQEKLYEFNHAVARLSRAGIAVDIRIVPGGKIILNVKPQVGPTETKIRGGDNGT